MSTVVKTIKEVNEIHESKEIYELFIKDADKDLNSHPFKQIQSKNTIHTLLPHFLAISTAFPYIQAGSQLPLMLDSIETNKDMTNENEILAVVGNFLCWDETGGAHILNRFGKPGLSKILETKKWFHANMLKKDIYFITGTHMSPDFSEPTRGYLLSLIQGFSELNPVVRCAHMVAFEYHAGVIIKNLWEVICEYFNIIEDKLTYFKIHVGDDDPAEMYHTEMTKSMISHIVSSKNKNLFLNTAKESIKINLDWARKLVELK